MNTPDIRERILDLKSRRNAVILAHNYQIGEVQDIADFVGDSLELSRKAAERTEDVIVFCGVHFMAETAAILAPDKTVLLPDATAGCPMADMITAEELRRWKARYPGRKVVCYVNTSAEVKAESDVCCTSSNAVQIIESLPDEEVLFVPDKNLAAYAARMTGKTIRAWDGYCYVHHRLSEADIREKKRHHPDAEVWAHPECPPDVLAVADRVFSTGKMVAEARLTSKTAVILATEPGIIHRLKKENPGKDFFPASDTLFCSNMKKTTLEKIFRSLTDMVERVVVSPDIASRARGAIEAMLAV